MSTQIACSACRAVFAAGPKFCPSCGLQLTAQAVPVLPRRKSILMSALIAIGIIMLCATIGGIISGSISDHAARKQQDSLTTAVAQGQLGTPAAFEAHCGQPQWTKQVKDGSELHYRRGAADYYVTFAAASTRYQSEQIDWTGKKPTVYRINLDPLEALNGIGCK